MKLHRILAAFILSASLMNIYAQNPVREFRGAWLHTVWQTQYKSRSTEANKKALIQQLDSLHKAGINAVFFQVRPQADAFYESKIEPWSCYLTEAGKAPVPFWDPLEFVIEECHARGMELHAWLNPYRVTSNARQIASLPKNHIYHKHPERFLRYDGKLYFDPGLPENREFIGRVVEDIIRRYDVDGIHFDDYFYPYPVKGKEFPDSKSYARYGKGMKRADWRRHNVDLLIEEIHTRIASVKPWVRFGVSPFGIYRNKKSDPKGSDTNGLENYDSLYADVLLWENKGWVDYLMPQLYWELDHKSASYRVLIDWWNNNVSNRHLYIGEDVARTMKTPDSDGNPTQLARKVDMARKAENIQGVCWWPGYSVCSNIGGVADSLSRTWQSTPALVPSYPWISDKTPSPVENIRPINTREFKWKQSATTGSADDVVKYAIYRFESRSEINLSKPGALVDVITQTEYKASQPGVYVVTALSRVNNESAPSNPIVIGL